MAGHIARFVALTAGMLIAGWLIATAISMALLLWSVLSGAYGG